MRRQNGKELIHHQPALKNSSIKFRWKQVERTLTASSISSSSVLTVNGQKPFMCLALKKDIWGTLPSCLSMSRVQVLALLAPLGMRVRSSVRSPDHGERQWVTVKIDSFIFGPRAKRVAKTLGRIAPLQKLDFRSHTYTDNGYVNDTLEIGQKREKHQRFKWLFTIQNRLL